MTIQLAISSVAPDVSRSSSLPWTEPVCDEEDIGAPSLRFEQDCEIYGEGEEAASYYKVVSGDVFGIEAGSLRSLTAEAVSDCRIISYRRLPFDKAGTVSVSQQLVTHLLRNFERAQEHAVLLGRRSAVEKVAAFLLGWARQSACTGTIALAMTRLDIGDYLGLTIETVSRTLSQLERDEIIELPSVRQIRVKDLKALTAFNA
jgi:CRP/FNR family nitrogen fixation transcriptional regulator